MGLEKIETTGNCLERDKENDYVPVGNRFWRKRKNPNAQKKRSWQPVVKTVISERYPKKSRS